MMTRQNVLRCCEYQTHPSEAFKLLKLSLWPSWVLIWDSDMNVKMTVKRGPKKMLEKKTSALSMIISKKCVFDYLRLDGRPPSCCRVMTSSLQEVSLGRGNPPPKSQVIPRCIQKNIRISSWGGVYRPLIRPPPYEFPKKTLILWRGMEIIW